MEEYIGTIKMFIGNFAPRYYMLCAGQELPISQYQALYSVLGVQYGGDGRTNFKLPDLRGRSPLGTTYTSPYITGSKGGEEAVALTVPEMPMHTHTANGLKKNQEVGSPQGAFLANYANETATFYSRYNPGDNLLTMAPEVIGTAGTSQPHENMPPFVVINYIICIRGLYPQRP